MDDDGCRWSVISSLGVVYSSRALSGYYLSKPHDGVNSRLCWRREQQISYSATLRSITLYAGINCAVLTSTDRDEIPKLLLPRRHTTVQYAFVQICAMVFSASPDKASLVSLFCFLVTVPGNSMSISKFSDW